MPFPSKNSLCTTSLSTSLFFCALWSIFIMVRWNPWRVGYLFSSQMSPFTESMSNSFLPPSLNWETILLYILSRVLISELMLQILLEMQTMASRLQRLRMSLYLWQMMDSIWVWEQGWKMMVSNFHRDWSLLSSLTVRSMTLEMRTRMSLAPMLSHSSMLYRKFCSFIMWSISSSTIIFVFYSLPIPFRRLICSHSLDFTSFLPFPPQNFSRMKLQIRFTVRVDMQFRQATCTVPELASKNSSTLVIREVFPHPVFPCRQSGELVPFSELEMKSKIWLAYCTLPGAFSMTCAKRSLSQGDLNASLSSLLGLGFNSFLGVRIRSTSSWVMVVLEVSMSFSMSSGSSSHWMCRSRSQGSQLSIIIFASLLTAHSVVIQINAHIFAHIHTKTISFTPTHTARSISNINQSLLVLYSVSPQARVNPFAFLPKDLLLLLLLSGTVHLRHLRLFIQGPRGKLAFPFEVVFELWNKRADPENYFLKSNFNPIPIHIAEPGQLSVYLWFPHEHRCLEDIFKDVPGREYEFALDIDVRVRLVFLCDVLRYLSQFCIVSIDFGPH